MKEKREGEERKRGGGIRGKEGGHDWHPSWGEGCLLVLRGNGRPCNW